MTMTMNEMLYWAEQSARQSRADEDELRGWADEAAEEAERRYQMDDGEGCDEQYELYDEYIADAHKFEAVAEAWEEAVEAIKKLNEALEALGRDVKIEWA